jgi:hypothetical protein
LPLRKVADQISGEKGTLVQSENGETKEKPTEGQPKGEHHKDGDEYTDEQGRLHRWAQGNDMTWDVNDKTWNWTDKKGWLHWYDPKTQIEKHQAPVPGNDKDDEYKPEPEATT